MADVNQVRRRFQVILAVLVCLCIAAGAVIVSPIGRGHYSRQNELKQLEMELQQRTREVAPLQGIDGKLVESQEQIEQFYSERLASSYADVVAQLGQLARANNVTISNVRYQSEQTELTDIRRVLMEASVTGSYVNDVKFINAIERSKLFYLINGVRLGEATEGRVRLQVRLETYIKSRT